MVDGGIALQLFTLEAGDLRIGLGYRGVLRQVPVDDQFGTVRRRKELLLHEVHAEQSEREGRDRHPDGDPAMTHANQKQAGERLPNPAFGFMMTFDPGGQDRDAKQGREQHRDNP